MTQGGTFDTRREPSGALARWRARTALKTIKISFAEEFLQIVTADELVASKPAERAGPAVGRTALCPECGKALTRNANGEWRACPHCV